MPAVNDVGAIDQTERFSHVVVGDQDADAATLEMPEEVLDVADRDRVDAGERLVQQYERRFSRERARDFATPPLATRQRDRRRLAQLRYVELFEQRIDAASRAFRSGSVTSSTARMLSSTFRPRKIEASWGR